MALKRQKTEVLDFANAPAALEAEAIVQAIPDPLLVTDKAGAVVFANHAAQVFFNAGHKSLTGRSMLQVFGAAHPVIAALAGAKNTALSDIILPGGQRGSVSIIRMEDRALLVLRPLTAQTDQAWLSKSRAVLKPAQHLMRLLAHEIKNPLAGIRGAAQLLMKSDLKKDDQELAGLIDAETQRIHRLLDKVNVFEDSPRHLFKPMNIHAVTDHVVKAAKSGFASGVAVEVVYDPSLPEVTGHEDMLVQAVLNLVKNAAEAAPSKISIRTHYNTAAPFHPESGVKLPICVSVEDNGGGIDPDTLSHLFEPYFTTKQNGEGLGLCIVSKIVDDHGGVLSVASEPGKTVFKISLPRGTA